MSAKQIAIAHPISMKDIAMTEDPPGCVVPSTQYGIVTHEHVPPGTVIIWPAGGEAPVVCDLDSLSHKLSAGLPQQVPSLHPLTSPIPPPDGKTYWTPSGSLPVNPWKGSFFAAVDAEMKAMSKSMVQQWTASVQAYTQPASLPTTEFIDSSNPFAKALDAWQTGKAEWTKGTLYRPPTEGESA